MCVCVYTYVHTILLNIYIYCIFKRTMPFTFQIKLFMIKIKFHEVSSETHQPFSEHLIWAFFFPVKQKNKSETHTHTHNTIPHIYSCSHFDTHAYQVPHLNRCSGAILSSTPLSCHPSPASNPSLRRLPSVDQRCKTIPPAPELFLQPFIPASLLSN